MPNMLNTFGYRGPDAKVIVFDDRLHHGNGKPGWMQGYAQDHEDHGEYGPAAFPAAIVELEDGRVKSVHVSCVKFVSVEKA